VHRALAIALVCVASSASAANAPRQVRLAATLFGETVGEVELSLTEGGQNALRYRSDLRVIRDQLRFRSKATIEVTYEPVSGHLLKSSARRCTEPEAGSTPPDCRPPLELSKQKLVPAMVAELLLSRFNDGREHCIDVIDEESQDSGPACATAIREGARITLTGNKLGEPFRAVVRDGLLTELEFPNLGARFVEATGTIEVSEDDLFSEPVPSRGDPAAGIRQGTLRLQLWGPPPALQLLREVQAPGQSVAAGIGDASLHLEIQRQSLPKGRKAREILDRAALLFAKARGQHADCQAASSWFAAIAKERRWKVEPAVGIAFVDGRFAFHQWTVIVTPEGKIPVDPLLAQVPADAGHIQLSSQDGAAGHLLVQFRRGLSIVIE
jgi:hypothetical protein